MCLQGGNKIRSLGAWVATQRTEYRYLNMGKPSQMTDERIEKLKDIGFEWSLRPEVSRQRVPWEQRFAELKQYKDIHKHCNVPARWKGNPQLGLGLVQQRREYRYLKEGKPSQMTDERIRTLESIGFRWSLRPELNRRHVPWEQRFAELKQYKQMHKHCNVPRIWKENPQLGNWVNKQRTMYRYLKQGKSSLDRIRMLESIGFEWSTIKQEECEDTTAAVSCRQPEASVESRSTTSSTATQSSGQTDQRPKGVVEKEKADTWNGRERAKCFSVGEPVSGVGAIQKHCNVPARCKDNPQLDHWVLTQPWEQRFEELKQYKRIHKHCNVPQKLKENPRLGAWVAMQRTQYRYLKEGKPSQYYR